MYTFFSFASFISACLSFIGVVLSMTQPLFWIEKTYFLHLFPGHDELTYTVSRLHEHSQNLHIATSVFIGMSVIFCLVDSIVLHLKKDGRGNPIIHRMNMVMLFVSGVLYVAAIGTLIEVGKTIKDRIDNIPLPLPNLRVDMVEGGYMDFVGLVFIWIAVMCSFIPLASSHSVALEGSEFPA